MLGGSFGKFFFGIKSFFVYVGMIFDCMSRRLETNLKPIGIPSSWLCGPRKHIWEDCDTKLCAIKFLHHIWRIEIYVVVDGKGFMCDYYIILTIMALRWASTVWWSLQLWLFKIRHIIYIGIILWGMRSMRIMDGDIWFCFWNFKIKSSYCLFINNQWLHWVKLNFFL